MSANSDGSDNSAPNTAPVPEALSAAFLAPPSDANYGPISGEQQLFFHQGTPSMPSLGEGGQQPPYLVRTEPVTTQECVDLVKWVRIRGLIDELHSVARAFSTLPPPPDLLEPIISILQYEILQWKESRALSATPQVTQGYQSQKRKMTMSIYNILPLVKDFFAQSAPSSTANQIANAFAIDSSMTSTPSPTYTSPPLYTTALNQEPPPTRERSKTSEKDVQLEPKPNPKTTKPLPKEFFESVIIAPSKPKKAAPVIALPLAEDEKRICQMCKAKVTPEWRKGPTGKNTLCNACGLRYLRTTGVPRKKHAVSTSAGSNSTSEISSSTSFTNNQPENSLDDLSPDALPDLASTPPRRLSFIQEYPPIVSPIEDQKSSDNGHLSEPNLNFNFYPNASTTVLSTGCEGGVLPSNVMMTSSSSSSATVPFPPPPQQNLTSQNGMESQLRSQSGNLVKRKAVSRRASNPGAISTIPGIFSWDIQSSSHNDLFKKKTPK